MTIGEKIKKFRTARVLSQKQLAIMSGMSEPAIRNYELGNRQPSAKQIEKIADALGVSPFALSNPDLESDLGFMHSLFAMEDMYGLQIASIDGAICLQLDKQSSSYSSFSDRLRAWLAESEKLKNDQITKDEYDEWRHSYPRIEVERQKQQRDKLREQKKESKLE